MKDVPAALVTSLPPIGVLPIKLYLSVCFPTSNGIANILLVQYNTIFCSE